MLCAIAQVRARARQGSIVTVMVTGETVTAASEMVNCMVWSEDTEPAGTEMTQLPPNALSLYWLLDSDVDHVK